MILEIVIGVSVISACITTITVASLSFVKKLNNEEKERAKLCREDNLPLIENVFGELSCCPFCNWQHPPGKNIPTGATCKTFMDKHDIQGLKNYEWNNPNPKDTAHKITGASSAVTVKTSSGYKVWQCCCRCYAEWLTLPSVNKDNSKQEVKVPPPPPPRKNVKGTKTRTPV